MIIIMHVLVQFPQCVCYINMFLHAGVLVQFSPTSYNEEEGNTADIMVIVEGQSNLPFSVQFSTRDRTATGT